MLCDIMLMCGILYWDNLLLLQLATCARIKQKGTEEEEEEKRERACYNKRYRLHTLYPYAASTNNVSATVVCLL